MREFPKLYQNAFFGNPVCKFPKSIMDQTAEWLKGDASKPLVIHGPYGSGKTMFSIALYRHISKRSPWHIWIPSHEIDQELLLSSQCDNVFEKDIITKYSECNLLFIDDLGVERSTDRAIRQYYAIIDNRMNANLRTVVTTNHDSESIASHLGNRIASRLNFGTWIEFDRPDQRSQENYKRQMEKVYENAPFSFFSPKVDSAKQTTLS